MPIAHGQFVGPDFGNAACRMVQRSQHKLAVLGQAIALLAPPRFLFDNPPAMDTDLGNLVEPPAGQHFFHNKLIRANGGFGYLSVGLTHIHTPSRRRNSRPAVALASGESASRPPGSTSISTTAQPSKRRWRKPARILPKSTRPRPNGAKTP